MSRGSVVEGRKARKLRIPATQRSNPLAVVAFLFGCLPILLSASVASADEAEKLIHNSTNTYSNKWGNNWGVTGGKYGTFTCLTCHARATTNIKRIVESINISTLPGDGVGIEFGSAVDNSAEYGDDSFSRGGSNRICEVCHSVNKYHNYDRDTNNSSNLHYNKRDCMACHTHRNAFRPTGTACNQCHGGTTSNAPNSGAHAVHTRFNSNDKTDPLFDVSECDLCHTSVLAGSASGNLQYGYDPASDRNNGYNHGDVSGRIAELVASVGYNANEKTCASACHASMVTDGGWNDSDGLDCDSCHGNPPTGGGASGDAHGKHVTGAGMACSACHGTVDDPSNGPLAHKHAKDTSTDALWLTTQGKDYLNPGGQDIFVDDGAYNDSGSTWINSEVTDDGGNSCGNVDCHDPSDTGYTVDWDSGASACTLCHSATDPGTGAHSAHMTVSSGGYGGSIVCTTCHPDNATNNAHRSGTVDLRAAANLVCHGCHNLAGGACGGCHAGTLGEMWAKTDVVTGCGSCHSSTPATGAHTIHRSGTYGPVLGTDCSGCHVANANNTSMAGIDSHMNSTRTFRNLAAPETPYEVTAGDIADTTAESVDTCDNCHGGRSHANLAKDKWESGSRVGCESCHGVVAATRYTDGSGAVAPVRAGTTYGSYGHGKVTGHPTYGGNACTDCHNDTSNHISGALGDANRLAIIGTVDYGTDPNGYCGVCHSVAVVTHDANSLTPGGNSIDGDLCISCHDPHGSFDRTATGQDAMVRGTIGGKEVVGMYNTAVRGSYYVLSPGVVNGYGICQVCHDPAEVSRFNQTTANSNHQSGSNCIVCHPHNKASGAFHRF